MRLHLAMGFSGAWGGAEKLASSLDLFGLRSPDLLDDTLHRLYGEKAPPPMREYLSAAKILDNPGPKSEYYAQGLAQGAQRVQPLKLRILLSYWYYRDTNIDQLLEKYFAPDYPDIFADSGAFSAYSHGSSVDVSAYADWLHRWKHRFCAYANLDVKGDVGAGLRNQQILERAGLAPLPVYHGGEPWSVLEDMVNDYPYIALGGIAGSANQGTGPIVMRWLIKAFQTAKDGKNGPSVYHGFGMTGWQLLKSFPWYSADSSSWGSGFRFARVNVFDERRGDFVKLQLGQPKQWYDYAPLIRSYGINPAEFLDNRNYNRALMCALAAMSYMRAEAWLRRRHGEVALPVRRTSHDTTDTPELGPNVYLTNSDYTAFTKAQAGLSLPEERLAGMRLHLADSNPRNLAQASTGMHLHLADANSQARDTAAAWGVIYEQQQHTYVFDTTIGQRHAQTAPGPATATNADTPTQASKRTSKRTATTDQHTGGSTRPSRTRKPATAKQGKQQKADKQAKAPAARATGAKTRRPADA